MFAAKALARFIRRVMRDVRYAELAQATVTADRGDGTVDVEIESPAFRGSLGRVETATPGGVPSSVAPGTRCLVSFSDGRKPSVVAWEFATDSAVVTFAGDDGTAKPVARLGDLVSVMVSPADQIMGALAPPSPAAQTIIQSGVPTLPPGLPVILTGIVLAGEVSGQIATPYTKLTG